MPETTNNRNTALMRLVEQQVESLDRSAEENEERAKIRENVDKLGIDPKAFQAEVGALRRMKPKARDYYIASQAEMRELLQGKREELFPDIVAAEAERDRKKAEKAAAKPASPKPGDTPSKKAAAAAETKLASGRGKKGAPAQDQAPPADEQAEGAAFFAEHGLGGKPN